MFKYLAYPDVKMQELKPTPTRLQRAILEKIVKNDIKSINYHHPDRQLGEIADYKEILNALRSLERDFQVLRLHPKTILWFNTTTYDVNREQAKSLYAPHLGTSEKVE